jgi:hypothetical protein
MGEAVGDLSPCPADEPADEVGRGVGLDEPPLGVADALAVGDAVALGLVAAGGQIFRYGMLSGVSEVPLS